MKQLPGLAGLGLGTSQLGNLYRAMLDEAAAGIVGAAWEGGIRYFDTSPHYGMGLSERRLGALLAQYPRDEYVLSTKVGRLIEPNPSGKPDEHEIFEVPPTTRRMWDFSRDGVLRSIEASLERLRLDRIDIIYLHDIDVYLRQPGATWQHLVDEAAPALAELRDQGVIAGFGAGTDDMAVLARLMRDADVDVVIEAGRYTLLEQSAADEVLPLAQDRGVTVVAAAVFNSGLLGLNRPSQGAMFDYATAPSELVERANRIADVCERFGVELPAAAIAFPLRHPAVGAVLAGADNADQVRQNLARTNARTPEALWNSL